ncbi:MAG: hypothetical protein J6S95_02845 [Lachnospiraceae bacterium]|nr:hypothetical protein [Lachnospiraceae bacterium]
MKKAIAMFLTLGMVLTLTACGEAVSTEPEPDPVPASTEVSASVSEDPAPVDEGVTIDADTVIENFKNAQAFWFVAEGAIATDYEDSITGTIRGFENEFYRVNEPGMSTYDDMVDTLSAYVDASFVKDYIDNNESYLNSDGNMYVCPAGRGDDLSLAWVEYSVDLNGERGTLILTIHRQDYFDSLQDWYETGDIDEHEFPFTVSDGHAVFDKMEYICMYPEEAPIEGHDPDSLDAALIGLIAGTWTIEGGDSIVIEKDGSFSSYLDGEERTDGFIFTSRSDDGTYMMNGEDFNNTIFKHETLDDGTEAITFDSGSIVYTRAD